MSSASVEANDVQARSEDDMRILLRSLQPALEVRPSNSHGHNDCLTDSILLAMADQGLITPLDTMTRMQLCTIVRKHLELTCNLCPNSYPFLAHDRHFEPICHALREHLLPHWKAQKPFSRTALTCIVLDRSNRQLLPDASGM